MSKKKATKKIERSVSSYDRKSAVSRAALEASVGTEPPEYTIVSFCFLDDGGEAVSVAATRDPSAIEALSRALARERDALARKREAPPEHLTRRARLERKKHRRELRKLEEQECQIYVSLDKVSNGQCVPGADLTTDPAALRAVLRVIARERKDGLTRTWQPGRSPRR